ncbi:MAG TPA: hypothetical protein VNI01_00060, partial [Elusimicrobiota bacterium]|nr:hypothetical protein [Elusimicrobiota bacterium]
MDIFPKKKDPKANAPEEKKKGLFSFLSKEKEGNPYLKPGSPGSKGPGSGLAPKSGPAAEAPAPGAAAAPSAASPGDKSAAVPMWTGATKPGTGLKVRGGSAGVVPASLTERFRRLRSRDLVFIAAGLAVLVMAPLAEYLMTNPEAPSAPLQPGFDQRGSMFPEGASPYEDGVSGVAPGGLLGQDSDVITPLNVRDPSALIIGQNGQQTPAAAPVTAKVDTTTRKDTRDWKDAISQAARGAGVAAVKKSVGLPRPSGKLAGTLRGLGALQGGGGGPSMKLEPPTSKGLVGGKGGPGGTAAGPGFRGAGGRSLFPGTGGGGNRFTLPGSPTGGSLDVSGNGSTTFSGTSDGRQGGSGDSSNNPAGNSSKDNKSTGQNQQENLALLRAKMEMEQAIKLKWDKRRYDQLERKKMFEQIAT